MKCMMKFQQAKNIIALFLILILFFSLCWSHRSPICMEEIKENIKLCSLWIKMRFLHPTLACRKTHERSCISSTFPSGITGWFYLCQCKQWWFQPATGTIIFTSVIDYKANSSSRSTSSLQACHHIPGHRAPNGSSSSSVQHWGASLWPWSWGLRACSQHRQQRTCLDFLVPAFLAYLGFPSSKRTVCEACSDVNFFL